MKQLLTIILISISFTCFSQGNSTKAIQDSTAIKKAQIEAAQKRYAFVKDSTEKAEVIEYITEKDMETAMELIESNITVADYKKAIKEMQAIQYYRDVLKKIALDRKKKNHK